MTKAKGKIEHERALALAEKVRDRLAPACERIEIAGSLRRGVQYVGDIELVAIPRWGQADGSGLFQEPQNLLEKSLYGLVQAGKLDPIREGPKQRTYRVMGQAFPIQLDLFITTADAWGYQLAIRTGPAQYSRWLVTRKHAGGPLEYGFRCHDGHVWRAISGSNDVDGPTAEIDGTPYVLHPVPEETDFFNLIDGGWKPPGKRRV